jgi:DNA helicase-2/ATP-dependent DNA helicase PcrA
MEREDIWNEDLEEYYKDCLNVVNKVKTRELQTYLDRTKKELSELEGSLKKGIVDIFYEIISNPPLLSWVDNPIKARNLAIFSDLLTKYQQYYRLPVIRSDNLTKLSATLFNSFFYAIRAAGLDEYEDPYNIFPSNHIQVMTIHQAKGLEFPVVIVGSLDKRPRTETYIDKELELYSKRKPYEPYDRISTFDHYRLLYVAFARAMDLLVLTCDRKPNRRLEGAFGRAPELTSKDVRKLTSLQFKKKEFLPPKREFSIAGHIHMYDVCPKQYKYYQEYKFTGARSAGQTFGALVHQTIEDIHSHYLKRKEPLDEKRIRVYFERNVRAVTRGGVHPLAKMFLDMAWKQVLNYYTHNKDIFDKLVRAEEPILVERKDYVMSGVVDLIRGDKGELELLDFKAQEQKDLDERRMNFYKFQLAIYSKMIERKLGERPKRTYVYLTAESDPRRALFEIPIHDVEADVAEKAFDERAHKILSSEFIVIHKPPRDVCRNCDFQHGCLDRKRFYPDMSA